MIKKVSLHVITIATLVALSFGCAKKSDTAASAKKADTVRLLEAGAKPHAKVRYKIAPGTETASTMDFRLATIAATSSGDAAVAMVPGVRLNILAGPAMESKLGTRYDVRVVKAEAYVPEGASDDLAMDLRQGVAVLDNLGGTVDVDDRGQVLASEFNSRTKRPDVPVRLLVMLINARTSLARIPLPAEPIGLGARWEVKKQLVLYGITVNQVDTYTLVDQVGNELRLNISMQQTALPQTVALPDDGLEIAIETFRMSAQGDAIANLQSLSSQAVASGSSLGQMVVTSVNGAERVQIERTVDLRITPR